jgi:hypothetical protein
MTDMLTALTTLRDDPDKLQRFTEDPNAVLSELGVNPDDVSVQVIPGGNAPYANFKQAVDNLETQEMRSVTICGSVGYIACASVGG